VHCTAKYNYNKNYEGHSINKLQNDIILLVFKIYKMQSIRFVGNLILSTSCEFYYDNVAVTLFINIKYGDVAIKTSVNEQRSVICFLCAKRT